jgi:MFS family permease
MRQRGIPKDIKLLSIATTVRWIGWGFVEALIPVFIFSFAGSYAETGALRSIYEATFLLILPFAGAWADRTSSKTLLIIALLMYPFVSLSYFSAGVTGVVVFIVLARGLNGIAYALDAVGRATYFRRHTPRNLISSAFGYFETLTNAWWIVAVLASLLLVRVLPVRWIFLAIIPTAFAALPLVLKLKKENKDSLGAGVKKFFKGNVYKDMWAEVRGWNAGLRSFGVFTFFLGVFATVSSFFIPIYVYSEGASLQRVILITAALAAPAVLGAPLGRFADRLKRPAIFISLGAIIVLFVALIFTKTYWLQLLIAMGVGTALELAQLTCDGMATCLVGESSRFGRMSGAFQGIGTAGEMIGPVVLGLLIDRTGAGIAFASLAGIALLLLVFMWAVRRGLSAIPVLKGVA